MHTIVSSLRHPQDSSRSGSGRTPPDSRFYNEFPWMPSRSRAVSLRVIPAGFSSDREEPWRRASGQTDKKGSCAPRESRKGVGFFCQKGCNEAGQPKGTPTPVLFTSRPELTNPAQPSQEERPARLPSPSFKRRKRFAVQKIRAFLLLFFSTPKEGAIGNGRIYRTAVLRLATREAEPSETNARGNC